jgi:methionyl-tRNA synthetase
MMTEVGFGNDGDFSDQAMLLKVNNNLANELGNLVQRTLTMVFKNCEQAVPVKLGEFTEADEALLASARSLRGRAAKEISKQAIQKYAQVCIDMVRDANKYIDEMAPWALRKSDPERMEVVLYVIMEVLRHVAIVYQPLIPDSANTILDALTVPADERTFEYLEGDEYMIRLGSPITKPEGIFPRIEVPEMVGA